MLCFQVADLREFEEFVDIFPDSDSLHLYQSALQKLEQDGVPYRWASQWHTTQLNLNWRFSLDFQNQALSESTK
jgi:hypothetical protein